MDKCKQCFEMSDGTIKLCYECLEKRNTEFERILKKYGRHTGSCATRFIDTDIDPTGNTFGNCDCGLEKALKGK